MVCSAQNNICLFKRSPDRVLPSEEWQNLSFSPTVSSTDSISDSFSEIGPIFTLFSKLDHSDDVRNASNETREALEGLLKVCLSKISPNSEDGSFRLTGDEFNPEAQSRILAPTCLLRRGLPKHSEQQDIVDRIIMEITEFFLKTEEETNLSKKSGNNAINWLKKQIGALLLLRALL